jgi:hypothetical protein
MKVEPSVEDPGCFIPDPNILNSGSEHFSSQILHKKRDEK